MSVAMVTDVDEDILMEMAWYMAWYSSKNLCKKSWLNFSFFFFKSKINPFKGDLSSESS